MEERLRSREPHRSRIEEEPVSEHLWQLFAARISRCLVRHGHEGCCRSELSALHRALLDDDAAYRVALAHASSARRPSGRAWLWQELTATEEVRCGLLTVFRGSAVPLHDHPGANGFLLVLSGRVRVRRFEVLGDQTGEQMTQLRRLAVDEMGPGETSMLTAGRDNVHGLETEQARCVMLDVLVPPYPEAERTWYFPLTDLDGTNEIIFADRYCANGVKSVQRTGRRSLG